MSADAACIFCKIVRGEIPAARVLETEHAIAFMDINPVNPGHVLIVPKEHYRVLSDLPASLAGTVAAELPRLCQAVLAATGAAGVNVVLNQGRAAGQVVDHVHWHVLPRHAGDHVHWPWPHVVYAEGEKERLRARIAAELSAPAS